MKLTVGWLYFDLMNTYGDRGNVAILKERCEKRAIHFEVKLISTDSTAKDISECDLFLMGGAEDRQQKIVSDDLTNDKEKVLREKITNGTPGLYICGAYQFLGEYYEAADGTQIRCLDILPFHTKHPGANKPRLVGDIAVRITNKQLLSFLHLSSNIYDPSSNVVIGFENHGGRTYVHNNEHTLGRVLKGHGNNGEDVCEGALFYNTIGSYLHGPLLPRNPAIADFLLLTALRHKYSPKTELAPLTDELIEKNRAYLLHALHVF